MGWDDIDLSKVLSGMNTFRNTSVVNIGEYLDTFARAIQEKDQVTMPEAFSGGGVPTEEIIFSGAPVGSAAFKVNYRLMLTRLKAKINFPWTSGRSSSPFPWFFKTVLTDVNNASLHIVSQDDFRTAMSESAYDLLFSEGNLNNIAFDQLWTAEILQSIKPALELMQVFIPSATTSPSTATPVRPLILNQVDFINGEASTSIWRSRKFNRGSDNADFATALSENNNPWDVDPVETSAGARSYEYAVEIIHALNSGTSQPRWTIGTFAFPNRRPRWRFQDRIRTRYKTQDLNDVTIDMEALPVAAIRSNYRRSNNEYGPLTAAFNLNFPHIHPSFDDELNIPTPVDSVSFSASEGGEKVLSFWQGIPFDPSSPLNGEGMAAGTYEEDQVFQADDETFYVNTNNPALEFFIP